MPPFAALNERGCRISRSWGCQSFGRPSQHAAYHPSAGTTLWLGLGLLWRFGKAHMRCIVAPELRVRLSKIVEPCGASQPELSLLGGAHPLPEVEVVLATLWTVSSWRGVYAAYRAWANFF